MNIEQGERTDEEMMDFINEYEYDNDDTYFYIRQFSFEYPTCGGMRSLPMAYHRIIHTTMYTDEDNSTDLIGAFCELLFPRKGHRNGIIVDDYGNEFLYNRTKLQHFYLKVCCCTKGIISLYCLPRYTSSIY